MNFSHFYVIGISDLHEFVNVALHTEAGEDDLANDNLSRLAVVGDGYSSLIYGLPSDSSLDHFMVCCKKVFDALKRIPDLTKSLVSSIAMMI